MLIITSLTSEKKENKPLPSLINRVKKIMKNIKDLHHNIPYLHPLSTSYYLCIFGEC